MSDLPSGTTRQLLANPERRARLFGGAVLLPPPPLDLNQWARDNLVLGGESPYPGPYEPERFPFFWDILAALGPEEPARVVVLCGSAQIGKTLLAQIFAAASLDLDPGNLLYVHPTESN